MPDPLLKECHGMTDADYDAEVRFAGAECIVKRCTRCGETKPLEAFQRDRTHGDGRRSCCKTCAARIDAARHIANPERKRRNSREWYSANREYALRYRAIRHASNPESANERSRVWRRENKERFKATKKAWALAHPDMVRASTRRMRLAHPDRAAAHSRVQRAVAAKMLPRASTVVCEICGVAIAAHWHHPNGYDEAHRLDVVAVCIECHTKEHKEARNG